MSTEAGNNEVSAAAAAMDRLRDRTDELELIISSLTIFALFSLPGWLFNKLAESYTHLSTSIAIAGNLGTTLVSGICYGLGACFVIHLMARAYWVGLIGLRSAFPDGIQWDRTKAMGPITRDHYQRSLPELSTVIARTDRLASSLFAVISLITLGMLWFGTLMLVTLVSAGTIGTRFGLTNAALNIATLVLLILFAGAPLLTFILDGLIASRVEALRTSPGFAWVIGVLRRISSLAYPRRLILPVQLTLQSNLPPFIFAIAMTVAVVSIVFIGGFQSAAWQNFTVSDEFEYLTDTDVQSAFRSTHYEDMPSDLDRLRGWPRISSFTQSASHMRLFLPYIPLRDNLLLARLCGERQADYDAATCLRQFWSVSVEGVEVPMDTFIAAQRADISMRGLIGAVPLGHLEPGIHSIEVTWNPKEDVELTELDDRYTFTSIVTTIPFLFAPGYELPVN